MQTATSDAKGRYFIDLRLGKYEARLADYAATGMLYGRNPNTYGKWPQVTVVAGTEATVDLI